jgi:HEAT repeat protein
MIENLQKAWQGEGPDFQPLTVPRRKRKREHVGTVVKTSLFVIMSLVALRAGIDLSPPFRDWWRFRALQRQLLGPDDSVRADAAAELAVLSESAIPILVSALHDSRAEVREAALSALLKSPFGEEVQPSTLAEMMADPDARLRVMAIQSLSHLIRTTMARDSKEGIKLRGEMVVKFRAALKDTDPEVRTSAANALAALGIEAKDALPELNPLLKDLDPLVREAAARAVIAIDPGINEDAVNVLIESLAESAPQLDGWPALDALLKLGPNVAKAAVPTLVKLLEDNDPHSQLAIFRALKSIGPDASEALPALRKFLRTNPTRVRDMALQQRRFQEATECLHYEAASAALAIEGKAHASPWIIAALVKVLTDDAEPYTDRALAGKALKQTDSTALAEFMPGMIQRLVNEKNPTIRMQGFQLLQEIDPQAIAKGLRSDPLPAGR